jgi:hypothetical protein
MALISLKVRAGIAALTFAAVMGHLFRDPAQSGHH